MSSPHYTDGPVTIWHGDCLDVMRRLPDDSIDAVVTDPPYGLDFMGRAWDDPGKMLGVIATGVEQRGAFAYGGSHSRGYDGRAFQAWCEQWAAEAYRLLKPGGHLLAFGGSRTWHRLTAGIEDAGFEIRDSIAWLYGSGFPKSLDVAKAIDRHLGADRPVVGRSSSGVGNTAASLHKREGFASSREQHFDVTGPGSAEAAAWAGWGTALKPSFEPIVVARKPLTGTVAANVLAYGTGALNIDASRVGNGPSPSVAMRASGRIPAPLREQETAAESEARGRLKDRSSPEAWAAARSGEQLGRWPANVILDASQAAALDTQSGASTSRIGKPRGAASGDGGGMTATGAEYDDTGGASRFFYTAKASTDERPSVDGIAHPTVKPVDLMRWLVKLVTPPGGTVLEPFAGSGTTVEAAVLEGFRCVAIEREGDYLPLILQRIRKPHAVGLDLDWDDPTPAPARPTAARRAPVTPLPAAHPGFDFGDDWELDA